MVERSLSLAADAPLEDMASLAEAFADLQLRIPLRDMLPSVVWKVAGKDGCPRPGPEALPSVVRLLGATGRANLYVNELFEFCSENLSSMQVRDFAMFVFEAGRHGLRCRHFLDAAVGHGAKLLPQMGLNELMWVWQGLLRFSRDRKEFYVAALPRVRGQVGALSVPQLLMALRIARDLKMDAGFIDLHAACCTELIVKADSLSLSEAAQCLQYTTYFPRYRAQAQGLVRSVEQRWARTEDLSGLKINEVVDALDTLASWGMKPVPLLERIDAMLLERQSELKYAGNVSLWITAVAAFAKMEYTDGKWPLVALEWSRDKLFVEKTNFFLQCTLVANLSKLRLFDETAYRNIAELIASDIKLFKHVQDLAPVLQAYSIANYRHPELFDSAYDLVLEFMEAESMDLSRPATQGGMIQVSWSFAAMGYHREQESFAAFLDYSLFTSPAEHKPPQLRRLAQLADLVLQEAPQTASCCQYPDRLEEARANKRIRNIIATDPTSEPKLLQELRTTLQEMKWPFEVFSVPDETAACYVDISLQPKFGQKVGLLLAGHHQLFSVGLPSEGAAPRFSNHLEVARRLLASRGWKTAVVQRDAWSALQTLDQRRAFLESLTQSAA